MFFGNKYMANFHKSEKNIFWYGLFIYVQKDLKIFRLPFPIPYPTYTVEAYC